MAAIGRLLLVQLPEPSESDQLSIDRRHHAARCEALPDRSGSDQQP